MMSTFFVPMLDKWVTAERINEFEPAEPPLGLWSGKLTKVRDVRVADGSEHVEITLLGTYQEYVFEILSPDWYYWGFTITETEPPL